MKFHTQLTAKDIFKFSVIFTYFGTSGILAVFMILVGGLMAARGIVLGQGPVYIAMGILIILLFVVINPMMLYMKAKKQVLTNPVYQVQSYYTMQEDGIFVEIGEQTGTIEWNRIYKIRHMFGLYILYTGRQQAFVFPEEAMGSEKDRIMQFIEEHVKTVKAAKKQPKKSAISQYAKAETKEETTTETEE
jgi:hypothetical protein